ncbi:hypothetical protein ACL9RF_07900 [Sphingobacterium sp. Mn56C]|uniref:DUF4961 domain-containing protein n=1 Tax=Sphingobacterium sp. Mn56C TaxID=3395261 RepID=UPI003BC8AC63
MKKILYLLFFGIMLIPMLGKTQTTEAAGSPAAIWTYPLVYNTDEKVNWYFDLEGTLFTKGQDLYLWAWSPSEPDVGNWANSSDFAKLTYVKDMTWRMEITPTQYFKRTVDEIYNSDGFWMRIKDKKGTQQTDVFSIPKPDVGGFAQSETMYAAVPASFTVKTPMSILFNANLTNNKDAFLNATSVHLHAGLNNWEVSMEYHAAQPERSAKTKMVNMGKGIFRIDFTPFEYFEVDDDYPLENITFLAVVKDWANTAPDGILYAANVPIPAAPVFSVFPQKFSKNDILTLVRDNNPKGQQLFYTLKGGSTTLRGEIPGTTDQKRISFNLAKAFKDDNGKKLTITVKDQNDNVIYDKEIPFVEVDRVTK